jgi:hypothetical protein
MANVYAPPNKMHVAMPDYLIDLFGRLRASEPIIQLQVTQSDPSINLIVTEGQVSGSGTSGLFSSATASTNLSVDTNINGLRRYRTRVPGLYQAGKSLFYMFTFNLLTQGELAFVLRSSSITGIVEETVIPQSLWNVDKFDGTGQSKITLDQTKAHIGFLGFEWLGVGDIICGFIHDRTPSLAHIFNHKNCLEGVYMRTANLFPSFEIESKDTVITKRLGYFDDKDGVFLQQLNGGNTLKTICCSLINEGAIDRTGTTYSITRNINDNYTTGISGESKTLMLFRLNPACINSRVMVTSIEVVIDTDTNFYLYLCRQPTFSGAVTPNWVSLPNRSLQYDPDPATTTVSVTNLLSSSIWSSTGASNRTAAGTASSYGINSIDYLGSEFDGTPELWALVISCSTLNSLITNVVIRFVEEI